MEIRPKQYTRMGEFYLEEAILDVLLDAKHENECLGAVEISKRTGIFRDKGGGIYGIPGAMNDAIVTGMLIKLAKEKRIQRCDQTIKNRKGWELTDSEFEKRRDDI